MFHPKGPGFFELAHQALSSTVKGYDLLAPKFDYTPYRTPDIVIDATLQTAFSNGGSAGAVLDLCCGTGAALSRLLPYAPHEVVGLDFSPGMLAIAQATLQPLNLPQLQLVHEDARTMKYANRFNTIMSFGAFGHIQKHEERGFLANIYKALTPGGRFIFCTAFMPPVLSLPYLLARGFNGLMRLRNLLPGPQFIMYYLTFMLPQVEDQLQTSGFHVQRIPLEGNLTGLWAVIATRPDMGS